MHTFVWLVAPLRFNVGKWPNDTFSKNTYLTTGSGSLPAGNKLLVTGQKLKLRLETKTNWKSGIKRAL